MTNPDYRRRKSPRLQNFDYTQPRYYFVTICTHHRAYLFGQVVEQHMQRSSWGQIAHETWPRIATKSPFPEIDCFVVMPNHVHAVIRLTQTHMSPETGSLSTIVRFYKAAVTRRIRRSEDSEQVVWQRSFHDHIIRTEPDLNRIRQYIAANPALWKNDRFFRE